MSELSFNEICAQSRLFIDSLRSDANCKRQDQFVRAVYNHIVETELKSEGFFIIAKPTSTPFLVSGLKQAVYPISSKSQLFLSYLFVRYGINGKDRVTPEIIASLQHLCLHQGWERESRRFAAYDITDNTLYLSCYDGKAYKIQDGILEKVPNGKESYLFVDDDKGNIPPSPVVAPHGKLLPFLLDQNWPKETPSGMTADQQKKAFTIWIFAVAFPDLFVTKPLLIFEGPPGSGKSTSLQLTQKILLGEVKPLIISKSKGEDELPVQLLRSPIAILDNIDDYISWMPDAICAYLTLGVWTKRKLYTDDEENTVRPHSFIGVASKNPTSFKREDTADRTIVLRLERREENGYTPMARLMQRIKESRDELYGEWLYYVIQIVKELKKSGSEYTAGHRMADWEGFAKVVAKVMKWTDQEIEETLDALQRERDAFAGENDTLSEILDKWLDTTSNSRKELTASDLFSELKGLADKEKKDFLKSPNSLAQKLRAPYLTKLFKITSRTGHGGKKIYSIKRIP